MAVSGKVIRPPGNLTGMVVAEATKTSGREAVYLGFSTGDGEYEQVELTVLEAVQLHKWLAGLAERKQAP